MEQEIDRARGSISAGSGTSAAKRDGRSVERCTTTWCRRSALSCGVLLIAHAGLLAWSGFQHSPTVDELGHLPAGISHWRFLRFDLYCVNPPLVRALGALPLVCAGTRVDWIAFREGPGVRPEWSIGGDLIRANGRRSFWYFTLARWAVIPVSLVGAYFCYRWASDLYGPMPGVTAAALWCFSPNILAHAALITPDAGAAALGVAAGYFFWRWLQRPDWARAVLAGLWLGLAELTKSTWIVLFVLWPVLWFLWRWPRRRELTAATWSGEAGRLSVVLLLAVYVLNVGYGFEDTFRRLRDFEFVSQALTGVDPGGRQEFSARNRFAESWLGALPVPFPKHYLIGIDVQKGDFERGKPSYLGGEWREGGWWYYYAYAAAVKVPVGTWVLAALALGATLWSVLVESRRLRVESSEGKARRYWAGWRNELALLLPAIVVFALVSSQTGFSHHFRYVLPCFPFAFIWISKVARSIELRHWLMAGTAGAAFLWATASSLWVYPHSLSYFNELAGGPTAGHAHLVNSNIDWGQDLLYLKQWLDEHPEARPFHLEYFGFFDPKNAGIPYLKVPDEPAVGWYAISVNWLRDRSGKYAGFLRLKPVAMAGYSIYIYHLSAAEADELRRMRAARQKESPARSSSQLEEPGL